MEYPAPTPTYPPTAPTTLAPVNEVNPASDRRTTIFLLVILVGILLFMIAGVAYYMRLRKAGAELGAIQQAQQQLSLPPEEVEEKVTSLSEEWNTYFDTNFKFMMEYPLEYSIDNEGSQTYLNRRITWYATAVSLKEQQGDGPVITDERETGFPAEGAVRLAVEYGSIGGGVPHEEVVYQLPNPQTTGSEDAYIIFRLSAVPGLLSESEQARYALQTTPVKIDPQEIEVFDQIMETVQFE